MKKDFVVNISKLTKAVSQKGFGLILILGTSKNSPYTIYNGIAGVAEEFGIESKEYKIAARIFGQNPAPQEIAIHSIIIDGEEEKEAQLVAVLNEVVNKNNDWYFLTSTENDDVVVEALSSWIDTQMKMYFATTQNLPLLSTLESEQTVVMYHDDSKAYVAEGLAAIGATNEPGSLTFKFKTVNGVLTASISATELNELHNNNGFSYVRKMGVLQTTEGTTTSGEYIDVVMGAHWIQARMEEECMYLAINNKKIPYDNAGIAMLAGVAHDVLQRGARQGIVLVDDDGKAEYVVNIVKRDEVSKNDIALRQYNGINWAATLAGAIHIGNITGHLVL